jgi:hypothetical protein
MRLPDKLDHLIARHVPRTSVTGEYITATANRAITRFLGGLLALVLGAVGIALLDSQWRSVLSGALLAWGASIVVWAFQSFGKGQQEVVDDLRRNAELDVLHARLNLISLHLGLPTIDLNAEWEFVVRSRMERIAHFAGLDEFRIFGDDWIPEDAARSAFWTPEAQGM